MATNRSSSLFVLRTLRIFVAGVCCSGFCAQAEDSAHAFTAQLDLRMVASDGLRSFTRGGFGLTRFDEQHEGPQWGRAFIQYRGRLRETLNAHVTLGTYADGDKNPIDATEAFLEWRPWPRNNWRWRMRAGAFYPPVSLENGAHGWDSAYSLSSSAINTWLGEEIRALGTEVNTTWMGTRSGHAFDLSLIGGVYGWNDPAGVLIFQRGWGLHDRQTGLFGGLPSLFAAGTRRHQLEMFHEIDHKPGYYAGGQIDYPAAFGNLRVRLLRYDNRGDPAVANRYEAAWLTRFDSAGIQLDLPNEWTFIGQWMSGDTSVGPSADGRGLLIMDYKAYFALITRSFGKHRLTARFDDFHADMSRGWQIFDGFQDGTAQTLSYTYAYSEHWQGVAEAMRIDSQLWQRATAGLPQQAVEKTLQLALRYTFK